MAEEINSNHFVITYDDFLLSPIYKPVEKILFIILESHCGTNGVCWQSQTTLAKECHITRMTLIKTLDKLIKYNLIFYNEQYTENGRKSSNAYYVLKKEKDTGKFIFNSLDIIKNLGLKNKNNKNGKAKIIPGK
jgi:hypothetical protein